VELLGEFEVELARDSGEIAFYKKRSQKKWMCIFLHIRFLSVDDLPVPQTHHAIRFS
jgi:hypothetical protein